MAGAPISAYGKLPLSREFLIHACDKRGAQAVTDMLHASARALADVEPRQDALRLYFPLPGGRAGAALSLWPSTDDGGKRHFPFSMFTVQKPGAPATHPGFCTAYASLHEAHERLHKVLRHLESARDFERVMAEQEAPGPLADPAAQFAERAATYPTGRWAAALYGTEARRFVMSLWRLHRLALAGADQVRRFSCIRLPLVESHALETQADAWLGLVGNRIGSTPWPSLIAGRFGDDGAASLVVFFRPLEPDDFSIIGGRFPKGLFDLSAHKEIVDQEGFAEFATVMQERLTGSHATLRELPDILTGL